MFPISPLYCFPSSISYLQNPYFSHFCMLSFNQLNSYNELIKVPIKENIFFDQFHSNTVQNSQTYDKVMIQCPVITFSQKIMISQIEKQEITVIQKNKPQKNEEQDENYVPKVSNERYQTSNQRYTRKNIEANIINQLFSYLWSKQKSYKTLSKVNGFNQEKCQLFFQIMLFLKKKCKKLIHRRFLKELLNFKQGCIGYTMTFKKIKKDIQIMDMKEFSKAIRCIIRFFLSEVGCVSILTSKRMRSEIWKRHLLKCRQLKDFFFSSQQYK